MSKLVKIKRITGTIEVVTGLHIGGNKEGVEIGGLDNPVVKDPRSGEPYIPGSSIKGKMRFLLEWLEGKVDPNGSVHQCRNASLCTLCQLFGVAPQKNISPTAPTRLIVRDAHLTPEWKERALEEPITEEKTENMIDRIKGAATNPRHTERVLPGVEFAFECLVRIFDGDNESELLSLLKKGLKALEEDYLGGSGSRGYGRIRFKDLTCENLALPPQQGGAQQKEPWNLSEVSLFHAQAVE